MDLWSGFLAFITNEYFLSALSIVSFLFSIVTFWITNKVNRNVQELQKNTLDKAHFNSYRTQCISSLQDHSAAIKEVQALSFSTCREISDIFIHLSAYKSVFEKEDYKRLTEMHADHKSMCASIKGQTKHLPYVDRELNIITELITILSKGVYSI